MQANAVHLPRPSQANGFHVGEEPFATTALEQRKEMWDQTARTIRPKVLTVVSNWGWSAVRADY
jgi:hypothetical protein